MGGFTAKIKNIENLENELDNKININSPLTNIISNDDRFYFKNISGDTNTIEYSKIKSDILSNVVGENKILTQNIKLTTVLNPDTNQLETSITPTSIDYILSGTSYNIGINNPYEIGEYSATGLSRYVLFTISGSTDVNMTSSPESASPDIPVVQTNQLSLGYVFVSDNNVVDTTTVGQINIQYFGLHGSDTDPQYDGTSIDRAKRTPSGCTTIVGGVLICMDNGTYNYSEKEMNYYAPNATFTNVNFTGTNDARKFVAKAIYNSGNLTCTQVNLDLYCGYIYLNFTSNKIILIESALQQNGILYLGGGIDVDGDSGLLCNFINCFGTISGDGSIKGRINDTYYPAIELSDYVKGPSGSTNENIPVFNGITGKLIKDSGVKLTDKENIGNKVTGVTSGSTNTEYPSALAVYNAISSFSSVSEALQSDVEDPDTVVANTYISPRRGWDLIDKFLARTGNTYSELQTFSKGLVLSPAAQSNSDPNNSIINAKLGEALYFKTALGLIRELAFADGTIIYHLAKQFTPTGNVSTSGTTVTSVGTQFLSNMIGAKIEINKEVRYIATYVSTTQVTVTEAFSQNWTGITPANWGVYNYAIEVNSGVNQINFYNPARTLVARVDNGIFRTISMTNSIDTTAYSLASTLNLRNTFEILWSSTSSETGTKDLGLKRLAANKLQVTNGSTGIGNLSINSLDVILNQPQYNATSPTADTIGDLRTTWNGSTEIKEVCTVANATKGAGTWVALNSLSNYTTFGTGGQYTNFKAAYDAGFSLFEIVGNATDTVLVTVTINRDIKVFKRSNITATWTIINSTSGTAFNSTNIIHLEALRINYSGVGQLFTSSQLLKLDSNIFTPSPGGTSQCIFSGTNIISENNTYNLANAASQLYNGTGVTLNISINDTINGGGSSCSIGGVFNLLDSLNLKLTGTFGTVNFTSGTYVREIKNITISAVITNLFFTYASGIITTTSNLALTGGSVVKISNSKFKGVLQYGGLPATRGVVEIINTTFIDKVVLTRGNYTFTNCNFLGGLDINFTNASDSILLQGCYICNVDALGGATTITIAATATNVNIIGCFTDSAIIDNSGIANIIAPIIL
jgi:hypothetical protein